MNVSSLIKQYFISENNSLVDISIDVFEEKNIYSVYQRIVGVLTKHMSIETTVLQGMSYCFYEILDNVLTHSDKEMGTVITQYNASEHTVAILVADDGRGIQSSLSENEKYANVSESEALKICIKDSVTDGKGMGFGLYSTSLLVHNAGIRFVICSGAHTLTMQNGKVTVEECDFWQGTIIYLCLRTDKEINPAEVVAGRTDVAAQYNESFLNNSEIEELW